MTHADRFAKTHAWSMKEVPMKSALDPLPHKPDETLQIEAVWESAYEQVVRPEKVIALNAYFIRHLRLLGPELGWMYIGFRQAAYSAGGRNGQRSARFTGKAIAALSGSTERTFWNRAARPETWQKLAGLVNLVDEKPLWDETSPTPKRLPRKYAVSMTLPLTRTLTPCAAGCSVTWQTTKVQPKRWLPPVKRPWTNCSPSQKPPGKFPSP
jgi:hypothetical protein